LKSRWTGKKVDLNRLKEAVKDFFKGNGFETMYKEYSEFYVLQGIKKSSKHIIRLKVTISGTPDDFTIEFQTGENRLALMFNTAFTFWGLGGFILNDFKKLEIYQALEKKFWNYIERRIAHLTDSALLS